MDDDDIYDDYMLFLAMCQGLSDDEDTEEEVVVEKKRTHSVWTRGWILEKDDPDQENTIFKLQRQLQEV